MTDPVTEHGSDAIERALGALGIPLAVAEAHGIACGLLCSQRASAAKARWFAELLDTTGESPDALGETLARNAGAARALDTWFQSTDQALNSAELTFDPLLPDDDDPLARRFDALASFCAGYTYGLGLGSAKRGNAPLPSDTREILQDLQAIESADTRPGAGAHGTLDDDGDGDGAAGAPDEADYAELVEYVRVGVLVILEELRPVAATAASVETGVATNGIPAAGGAGPSGSNGPLH